ncbi:uncharacterized protein JCM15063_004033 [Sporobolomyces koalae]|uniref:uncharacterized protein n=1 Tax=Sporobolomyces koalae TaxID=500713 RepID=UPI00316FE1F5
MADFFRQYLCCCLPRAGPADNPERQPLLDPDVLPEAPPRAPPTRTTEEQEQEQHLRRKILNQASERLINILSPHPFTSPSPRHATSPTSPTSSRSSSRSSSPTLTASPRRSHRSSWRPPPNDPIAPVRVVHLGKDWQEAASSNGAAAAVQDTPSTLRRQQHKPARPASSHSMRTLPRAHPNSNQPSPLGKRSSRSQNDSGLGAGDDDEEEEEESRFGTVTSYKTAASRTNGDGDDYDDDSGARGSRHGLRDIWGTATEEGFEQEDEQDPLEQEQASPSLADSSLEEMERSIDDWKLTPVGPIVADLADYKPRK